MRPSLRWPSAGWRRCGAAGPPPGLGCGPQPGTQPTSPMPAANAKGTGKAAAKQQPAKLGPGSPRPGKLQPGGVTKSAAIRALKAAQLERRKRLRRLAKPAFNVQPGKQHAASGYRRERKALPRPLLSSGRPSWHPATRSLAGSRQAVREEAGRGTRCPGCPAAAQQAGVQRAAWKATGKRRKVKGAESTAETAAKQRSATLGSGGAQPGKLQAGGEKKAGVKSAAKATQQRAAKR